MAILDFLNKPIFDSRYKLPTHIVQVILVCLTIGLSLPRLFVKNQPRTRASSIALGMGAKSLIILTYMLVSAHVQCFKKWHSYKANVILSSLEIVFWGAVAFLVFQSNLDICEGYTCVLSWIVVGIAVFIHLTEQYSTAISIREFREYKKRRDTEISRNESGFDRVGDEEEMVQRYPEQPEISRPYAVKHNGPH